MWKPLSIVSGLLLLGAGGVMYTQIRPDYQSEMKQKEAATLNKQSAEANKRASDLAHTQSEKDLGDSKALLAKNTGGKNTAQAAKDEKKAEVDKTTTEKDAAAKELADLEQKLKDLGGLPRLVAELKVLEAKQAQFTLEVANSKGAIASTISHKDSTDKVIAGLKQLDQWQKSGTIDRSFRTRVASVNPDLGFVVIPAGNASKVTMKAKLDVKRGDTTVGKLLVTSIEQNRSICEVIPGSVAAGDQILPGDVVVVNEASTPGSLTVPAPTGPAKPAPMKPAVDPTAAPADVPADPFAPPPAPDTSLPPVTGEPMEEKKPEAPPTEPAPAPAPAPPP